MPKQRILQNKAKQASKGWFVAEDVSQNTIFMMSVPVRFFLQEWPKRGLGDHVKQYFTHYVGDMGYMVYKRDEFENEAKFLSNKMLSRPAWAIRMVVRVERWSKLFMGRSNLLLTEALVSASNERLLQLYSGCLKYWELSHGVGASISWHADALEMVTKGIWQAL